MTLLLQLLLNLHRTNDERIDPSPDHLLVPLALVLEKLKDRPEVPQHVSSEDQRLDIHERASERVESVVPVREGIKVLPEEKFGCGVDRESREEIFEVEGVLGVGVKHDVDNFLGVPLEQIEV